MGVNDSQDALCLVAVSLDGRRQVLLGMKVGEPHLLAKHGTLAAHLEHEPAISSPPLLQIIFSVTDEIVLIISVDDVLDNGARLEEGDIGVGVDHGRQTAVGVNANVWLLLDFRVRDPCEVIRYFQLGEDDDGFPRIGPGSGGSIVYLDRLHLD